jgi:hypothetical protein
MSGGGSPYIQEIVNKLNYVRLEVLAKFSLGEMGREWWVSLSGPADFTGFSHSHDTLFMASC